MGLEDCGDVIGDAVAAGCHVECNSILSSLSTVMMSSCSEVVGKEDADLAPSTVEPDPASVTWLLTGDKLQL